jgi:hypothetical protein
MSRQERIDAYSKPGRWVAGASADKSNIDYWSKRAETNSLHPKPQPPTKTPAIESDGVGKWR